MDIEGTRASASGALAAARTALRAELGGRRSGLAEAFELAGQFLARGRGDPALATQLVETARSPLDAETYAVEERHFPTAAFLQELWTLSRASAERHEDRRALERLGFGLDLPEIGEAVARRLDAGAAGARFALRYSVDPDYTNLGLHSGTHQASDEREEEDWVSFFGFRGALRDARRGLPPQVRRWAPGRASSNPYDHLLT